MEAPFQTLERARNEIRNLKSTGKATKSINVILREGIYKLSSSFTLVPKDSGTLENPITYRAQAGENVVIHGGEIISQDHINPDLPQEVLLRLQPQIAAKVVEIDLKKIGIYDYGKLRPVGFARPFGPAWAELFINGQPYSLARWPNLGSEKMGKVIDKGSVPRDGDYGNRGGAFHYKTDRPSSWVSHENIWISGYFRRGWAEDAIELAEIDTVNRIFRTKEASLYGFESGHKFSQWYVYNILEEVDEPGEYYIDRHAGKLYLYPKEDIETIALSMLEKPMFSLKGASNIHIKGLTFTCSRGMGIYMEGTHNILIANCTFKNLGIVGVCLGKGIAPFEQLLHEGKGKAASEMIGSYLQHVYADPLFNRDAGTNNGIVNCNIFNTGAGGIHLSGGDRLSLQAGNNYVENCSIHDFNRIEKSYRAGIDISGVGNRISNCEIYNAPSMAILMRGNNHMFEYNEIHHVCQEVHDQGALYYGRDPSERGHVVRYNFFHHLNSIHATTAVYHDDGACGMEVYGNIFYKPGKIPVLIGGGHDNPYTNNIFVDAELGIHIDNRNQNWAKGVIAPGGIYEQRLNMVKHDQAPYSEKYPALASYWEDEPALPKRNTISKNIFYKVKTPFRRNKAWGPFLEDNWITEENPGFVDENEMNFKLKKDAKAFSIIPGFKDIPFEKIGVQKNTKQSY